MNPLELLRASAQGKAILEDWIGEGGLPVVAERSEARAKVCTTCPKNHKTKWWEFVTHAKDAVAQEIHRQIEAKNGLGMRVACEDELGTCMVCFCNLPLKVHTPLTHILAHMKADQVMALPPHCWIVQESQETYGGVNRKEPNA